MQINNFDKNTDITFKYNFDEKIRKQSIDTIETPDGSNNFKRKIEINDTIDRFYEKYAEEKKGSFIQVSNDYYMFKCVMEHRFLLSKKQIISD